MNRLHIFLLNLLAYVAAYNLHASKPLKVLHMSFHRGSLHDFEDVANNLNLDLTSWYVHENPKLFDPLVDGGQIYNIGHARAQRVWEKNKEYFEQFDVILISDTAPLSRIFLQNDFKKHLVIWICNRFDYKALIPNPDCIFPDEQYYELFNQATIKNNVTIISYVPFEYHYAVSKGINIGTRVIRPLGGIEKKVNQSFIPAEIKKQETIFIYPRLLPKQMEYLRYICTSLGIKTYGGNYQHVDTLQIYNTPDDLTDFKGVIYFPYQWGSFALYENIQRGIVHFIPTEKFLRYLNQTGINWFRAPMKGELDNFDLCDWYNPEYRDLFIYFDSWIDLKKKIEMTDYQAMRKKIKAYAIYHRLAMLDRWKKVFDDIKNSM